MKKMEIKLCDITDKHKTLIKKKGLSLDRTMNEANTWLENNPKKQYKNLGLFFLNWLKKSNTNLTQTQRLANIINEIHGR